MMSKKGDLATYEGNCYLGIDAGSTTTKGWRSSARMALFYTAAAATTAARWRRRSVRCRRSMTSFRRKHRSLIRCSTGYGEALLKSALMLDEGEVETISHYYAAAAFEPDGLHPRYRVRI